MPYLFPLVNLSGQTLQLDPARLTALLTDIASPGTLTQSRFESVFKPGRMVKVTNAEGRGQLSAITSSSFSNETVTVSGLAFSGDGSDCGIEGVSGDGYELSVLNVYEYGVQEDATIRGKMDLIRSEIDPTTGSPFEGSEVSILDYVVDFQAALDCDVSATISPSLSSFGDISSSPTSCDNPGAARRVYLSITSRTARESPTVAHTQRATSEDPIYTFNIDPSCEGTESTIAETISTVEPLTVLTLRNLK